MTKKLIFLDDIAFKDSPHVRAKEPDPEVVQQYAEAYLERKELPPVVVFHDRANKRMLIADGRHRCQARLLIKRREVMAEIHEGDINDALRYALLANSAHGVPRSNADKRQCVIAAIRQWPELTDLAVSKIVQVDHKTVTPIRQELEKKKEVVAVAVRTTSDGRKVNREAMGNSPSLPVTTTSPADAFGIEIPKKVLKYWERETEVKDLLDGIHSVIACLKLAGTDKDPMYGEVNLTGTVADLEKAFVSIRNAVPYAVCTTCQGHPETQPKGCRLCLGRGLLSKWRYEKLVPEEVRALQQKRGKK